jgi:hypothetical protein
MCAWVARSSTARIPAGLSRAATAPPRTAGYDEARLLERLLPGIPHVLARGPRPRRARARAARLPLVVLDDGFQHRRLHATSTSCSRRRPAVGSARAAKGRRPSRAPPARLLREPAPRSPARARSCHPRAQRSGGAGGRPPRARELESIAPDAADPSRSTSLGTPRRERRIQPSSCSTAARSTSERHRQPARVRGERAVARRAGQRAPARSRTTTTSPRRSRGLARPAPLVVTAKDAPKLADLGIAFLVLDHRRIRIRSGALVLEALLDALPRPGGERARALRAGMHG